MDAFVDRLTSEFRTKLWEFIARSRPPEASSDEEAERIYDQLCRRSRGDLAQHVEAYLFLAVADMLEAYDRQGQAGAESSRSELTELDLASDDSDYKSKRRATEATAFTASAGSVTAENTATDSLDQLEARRALQTQLAALPPGIRSTLLLYRNYQMPLPEIARRLNLSVEAVQDHIKQGLLHCCLSRSAKRGPSA